MGQELFKGKTAIVTGAGQGIGLEICRQLAAEGANVLLNDVDPALARQCAEGIQREYGRCMAFAGDAADTGFIRSMVAEAVQQFGTVDIAVANAGITLFGEFLTYKPEDLNRVLQLNLVGTFFLVQQAALQMKTQGTGGRIVLMSSVTGHQAHKNLAAYGMTKAALEMLAKNLVIELSPYHITINAIAPGATLTERTLHDADYEKTWSRITPTGRPSTPQDIAHAALFLASPAAAQITGQSIVVDGGWSSLSPSPY